MHPTFDWLEEIKKSNLLSGYSPFNPDDCYLRVVCNNPPTESDFLTPAEKNDTDPFLPDLDKYSLSITQVIDHQGNDVDALRKSFNFGGRLNRTRFIYHFNAQPSAGKVSKTPSTNNQNHCSFYKSDSFSVALLDECKR